MNASERIAPPEILTKLPKVGTTIFTVMSALAVEKQAVNLGQGFPDFDCDPRLVYAVADAMRKCRTQSPPMRIAPTKLTPAASPIRQRAALSSPRVVLWANHAHPAANANPASVISRRGPYLSTSMPIGICRPA